MIVLLYENFNYFEYKKRMTDSRLIKWCIVWAKEKSKIIF